MVFYLVLILTFFFSANAGQQMILSDLKQKQMETNVSFFFEKDEFYISCPSVSSTDFTTLGPPDIPHKIRVIYKYSDTYPVISWESNDSQTTILDYDGGSFGAYFHENGYNFVNIKLTLNSGGTNCISTHILGWPQN